MGTYQPNTYQTKLKHIFSTLKQADVSLEQKHFTGFPGSYKSNFIRKFAEAAKARPEDFGRKPLQASTKLDDDKKICKYADPPLNPLRCR